MKLEIEVDDLETFVSAVNNAMVAYNDIRSAIYLFGYVPEGINMKWDTICNHDDPMNITEKFDKQLNELKNFYKQLEEIERREKDGKY